MTRLHLLAVLLLTGCPPSSRPDAGEPPRDAGIPDAAVPENDGGVDAGADAGSFDAGADAGFDAGLDAGVDAGEPWRAPSGWLPLGGPGGPISSFDAGSLGTACAYLTGGPADFDHHNIVHMFDGYLALPWAPEQGNGGLTMFDVSQPCSPRKVAEVLEPSLRETHAMAFSFIGGQWWAATNSRTSPTTGGVLIWDFSDPRNPTVVGRADVPGFTYPDAYARVVLSMAWQGTWLYLASGDLGVDIFDVSNPRQPRYVRRYAFAPTLRAFSIKAMGTLLFVHAGESPRAELLDLAVPGDPQPLPGGAFSVRDGPTGTARECYGANLQGGYAYFARKDSGGGVIVYDVRQPSAPTFAGISQTGFGNGGYVFIKDDHLAFVGESGGGSLYDLTDLSAIRRLMTFTLRGDLDTVSPVGNLAVLSVDEMANPRQSTAVVPWAELPDTTPPHVSWAWPGEGAIVPVTARFGLSFSEFVEPRSVFEGSVRFYETGTGKHLDGVLSAQESTVNFSPNAPLEPGKQYTLWVPRGGVTDWNGNAVTSDYRITVEAER